MPSVRVKRDYHHINDSPARAPARPRSRSLAAVYRPQPQQYVPPQRGQSVQEGDGLPPPPHPQTRPRAGSKVSQHIMTLPASRANQRARAPNPFDTQENIAPGMTQSPTRLVDGGMFTFEGPSTEVRVPAQGHHLGRVGSALSLPEQRTRRDSLDLRHQPDDVVEHLDVIDPQISTVSTLTNAMNAIVIPPLSFYSRKPVVILPRGQKKKRRTVDAEKNAASGAESEDEDALDKHVEDVLTKRARFRRIMQGVWSFVKTPLGFITAIYGFLVVFWGTGIVFFLAKFINLHNEYTQGFWVELCQQVETGLFTATSIGFIPFRIMDTYRCVKIWKYKRRITMLRKKAGLPELYDPDDLPDPVYDPNYVQVLTDDEQIDLHYQQHQFMASQTWYRPHGTQTHRAFPIDLALWICVCNDLNSFFQILLSGCMWGLDRFQRPAWTTATTLPAAFIAGIIAGVLIWWGGKKTRRTEQVEERLRIALEMDQRVRKPEHSAVDGEAPSQMLVAPSTASLSTATTQDPDQRQTSPDKGKDFARPSGESDMVVPVDGRPSAASATSVASIGFVDEMVVPPAHKLDS